MITWKEKLNGLLALRKRIDFTTDGCTGAPDFSFKACCVEHEYYYRNPQELTGVSRSEADCRLRKCIAKKCGSVAWIYWGAVRLFGWIPWNKAYRAAIDGDVSRLHPSNPASLKRAEHIKKIEKQYSRFDEIE